MSGNLYGYARVSSRDQNLDRQLVALAVFGVVAGNVFVDKASGKDIDRPEYRRLVESLTEGDVVVIKSIDRLGRNYEEILENIKQRQAEGIAAAQARGVRFGRPPKKRSACYEATKESYLGGHITRQEAADRMKVCVTTFDRWLKSGREQGDNAG